MTILLLFLLVLYFAVVSAPISIRLIAKILTRNSFGGLPLLRRSTNVRMGTLTRRECSST